MIRLLIRCKAQMSKSQVALKQLRTSQRDTTNETKRKTSDTPIKHLHPSVQTRDSKPIESGVTSKLGYLSVTPKRACSQVSRACRHRCQEVTLTQRSMSMLHAGRLISQKKIQRRLYSKDQIVSRISSPIRNNMSRRVRNSRRNHKKGSQLSQIRRNNLLNQPVGQCRRTSACK